jgi:DNA polymerase
MPPLSRSAAVEKSGTAARYLPLHPSDSTLVEIKKRAARCRACPLYKLGTQTVFGEGSPHARIVMVGEQPGAQEDAQGRPFVGPAGKLLDRALAEAGIDRADIYLTNTVKHFKWVSAGRHRLNEKANAREIAACRPWLEAELAIIKPRIVVALGATAAQTLLGKTFRVTQARGRPFRDTRWAPIVLATVHPSSILRAFTEDRASAFARFVADLKTARSHL